MPELSLHNIDQISTDIRRQEISFSHLCNELIDHVCCDVEYEMAKGLSFNEAYQAVKSKMGERRIKEIQEETLFAVDTKYRKMKKTMKISAIAGTVLLGFAALFKIMHWPGAGILMTLGALTLSFVFMPSALNVLWKETHSQKRLFLYISAFFAGMLFIMGAVSKTQHWPAAGLILNLAALSAIFCFIPALLVTKLKEQGNRSKSIVYILGALGLIFYIFGLLCKIQHWPGAGLFSMGGLAIVFFVVFPWYTLITFREESNISARFLFMIIGSIAIVVPSALITLNLQRSYEKGFFIAQQQQQAMFNYKLSDNKAFLKDNKDSVTVLAEIDSKTNELLRFIEGIEEKMIAESEGGTEMPAMISKLIRQTESGPEIQFHLLKKPFHTSPFMDFLQQGTETRAELNAAMESYSKYIAGLKPGSESDVFRKLLEPSAYLPAENSEGALISLMSALHMTALMKNGILTAESYAFSAASGIKN